MTIEDFINALESYPATIAAIAAVIAAIGVLAAFIANIQSRWQYKDSIQPQLSMSLLEFDYQLYLQIKNTGGQPAKSIVITVKNIRNNGHQNELSIEDLFRMPFELYPEETVQGGIAIYGADISTSAFPQIDIDVSYTYGWRNRKVNYSRSVTYAGRHGEKICADVNLDTKERDQTLRTTARAAVRIANYLDGRQVASFDELEILANRSLRGDLETLGARKGKNVLSRDASIKEAFEHREQPPKNDLSPKRTLVKYRKKRK